MTSAEAAAPAAILARPRRPGSTDRHLAPILGSRWAGLGRLALYVSTTLVLALIQAGLLALRLPGHRALPRLYHRLTLRIFGTRIIERGTPVTGRPVLYVANHTSYLDIPALGARLDASFVAKADVASWPVFGFLAKLQRSVFVDRQPRHAGEHRDQLTERLAAGDSLVLFAEGTSSDGQRVLPFKTTLFATVAGKGAAAVPGLVVQPVTLVPLALDGMPLGRTFRHLWAWVGDTELQPHLWRFLCAGRFDVAIIYHEPLDPVAIGDRKRLARAAEARVAAGFDDAIAGRFLPGLGRSG